jgi:rRNA-processing protein FCF1
MKFKVGKAFRKIANYMKTVFGFEIPFKIAVDGNFLHKALALGIDLQAKLSTLFEVPVLIDIF